MQIKKSILFLMIIMFSCRNVNNNLVIPEITFNHNQISNLDRKIDCFFIPLETTDENLMGHIKKVIVSNNKIYAFDILSDRVLHVFNIDGKYITQIGGIGIAPEEYAGVFNFHIVEDKNYIIIDDQLQNMLYFYDLTDYTFIESKQVPFNFSELVLLKNGEYCWYNHAGYQHANKNYCLITTDSTFQNIDYHLETSLVTSYVFGGNYNFSSNQDKLFHYSFISPSIYKITSNEILPVYSINIDGAQFPGEKYLKQEMPQEMGYIHKLINSDYISAYSFFETNIYFIICYFLRKQLYIGFHNKETTESFTYDYTNFIRESNLTGIHLPFIGKYNDYLICTFSPNILKRRNIKRKDLKDIADQISEEDNPVLCFFKINDE